MTGSDRVLVLTGPTAAGKKEIGLEIARRCGAEVIAVDSVKVYRGFVIGGAQPASDEHDGIPLHLVGVVDPREPYSVGRWLTDAAGVVGEIRARGRLPLFLGGTPLYLRALIRGFFDGPPSDPAVRRGLEDRAGAIGVEGLHARLAEVDPDSAAWIGPRDLKRIVRALEVHAIAGEPISKLQRERTRRVIDGDFRIAGITASDALLRERQSARIDRMLERGLVDEVRALDAAGSLSGEAGRAIGYREVREHLAAGTAMSELRDAIVRDTWELTRKQRKWFRLFPEICWVERRPDSPHDELVREVGRALGLEMSGDP